jgi:hypothetical protein
VVAGELAALECPGDHITMLEPPNVLALCSTIQAGLKQARAGAAGWQNAAE